VAVLKWGLLAVTIALEVMGSLSLKAALDQPLWFVAVAVGYLGAFTLLSQVLRLGMPIGVAYGIWGASGVALTALLSALLFGEPLTPPMLAGILLIIVGVLVIELGSQRAQRSRAAAEQARAAAEREAGA
jgi:small multidrug resistance pump